MCHAENGNEHAGSIYYLNILFRWTDVTFSSTTLPWCFSYALFKTLCLVEWQDDS
jgi:hypothetical protein